MKIISNTLLENTAVTTVEHFTTEYGFGKWTLIATAEGEDVLVLPTGKHVELLYLSSDDALVQLAYTISEMLLSGESVR